ncbi:Prefoldin subunit alpha [uncultured archaeon]|nr:Prefoldin subunit alpha [uncultured archaeon]
MDQKTMQQKAYEFEMHKEQMKQIQMQAVQIQRQAQEISTVKASLEELKKTKVQGDAFISLGAGIFASGKITDISEVLVMAGAGIAVKKSIDDAIAFLDDKLEILNNAFDSLDAEAKKIDKMAQELANQVQGAGRK